MKTKLASNSFMVFSAVYLLIILSGREEIAWFLKPFLLPFLLFLVYTFDNFPTKKILLFALTFSWFGDVILLFSESGKLYFIFGLIAFLISHVIYIILFNKQLKPNKFKLSFLFLIGIGVVLLYLLVLLSLLSPHLGDLKLPVIIYATVISTMLLFAFKGSLHWQKPANSYILFGAIIFVSSDSILAINKFYSALPNASFWIMLTYLAAQFLIVSGVLLLNKKAA
ncbi:lysoplasmalogenase [Flavobacterium sp.]|uniref:lysoplasmalogenase n=1 Tax=Flavobacterium sp. TaxID=239 RepID=UPI00378D7953